MVHRRAVITGTVLGGALSALTESVEAAGPQSAAQDRQVQDRQVQDRLLDEIAKAVRSVRDEIERQHTFGEIAAVREPLRTFLRANGKFPDFIEVGSDVWQQVYDWHVRFQQPIALGRTAAEGRYTILLLATNIVMRPDMAPGFIGVPFDNR
jgi:hypothetical protein